MRVNLRAAPIGAGLCLLALSKGVQAKPFIAAGESAAPAAAAAPVQFEVFLPLRDMAELDALLARQQDRRAPDYHRWLTPQQFKARFGPTAASMARAEAALRAAGFTIADVHTRSFEVTGTAGAVARTFATSLLSVQPRHGPGRLVGETGLVMPLALAAESAVILAFDGLPPARPHLHVLGPHQPQNRTSATGPYWYTDLKQAYQYPSYQVQVNGKPLGGAGVTVAVLMEHDVQQSDINLYFDHENFTYGSGAKADPTVVHLKIAGGSPYSAEDSVESSLDVEQVLGGAPGARVSLLNLPDLSDAHVSAGYRFIVERNIFDIVSSSFGSCELMYGPNYSQDNYKALDVYDTLFKQGAAQGITFIASSGDSGGLGCPEAKYFAHQAGAKFVSGVESPADDPNVTAVGGGNLVTTFASQSYDSAYIRESASGDPEQPYDPYDLGLNVTGGYFGAGGGLSAHFPRPTYQDRVRHRVLPRRSRRGHVRRRLPGHRGQEPMQPRRQLRGGGRGRRLLRCDRHLCRRT